MKTSQHQSLSFTSLHVIACRHCNLQLHETPHEKKLQAAGHNTLQQSAFMYASEESVREYIALLPSLSLHLPVHFTQTSIALNLHLLRRTEPSAMYQRKQITNIIADSLPRRHLTSRREARWHSPRRTREPRWSESRRHTASRSAFKVWIKG